jgi:hypothetical protein
MIRTMSKDALAVDLSGCGPANDRWFHDKMQEALAGLEDGSNAEIDATDWRKIAEDKRAELGRLAPKDR